METLARPSPFRPHDDQHDAHIEEYDEAAEVEQSLRPIRPRSISLSQIVKTCWICYEDSEDDLSRGPFIHGCSCALFAHENCLLAWIQESHSRSPHRSKQPVVCPQCSSVFKLQQPKSRFLDLCETIDRLTDQSAIRFCLALVGGSVVVASGIFGVTATRAFLGTRQANLMFASKPWKWSWFLNFPFIAPLLVLSRTSVVDNIIPIIPLALLSAHKSAPAISSKTWIPSPMTTIILLPWLRLIYNQLRRQVFKQTIAALARRSNRPTNLTNPSPEGLIDRNEPAVAFEQEGDAALPNAMTISVNVAARTCAGGLLLPFIGAGAGELLLELAYLTKSVSLRRILGLADARAWELALSDRPRDFLLGSLGLGTAAALDQSGLASWARWAGLRWIKGKSPADNVTADGLSIDPVWWRNALGGCLFIFAKDALLLIRKILDIRRRQARKIRQTKLNPLHDYQFKDDVPVAGTNEL